MLLNITNHPAHRNPQTGRGGWSEAQMAEAIERFGEVVDLGFPQVPAEATGKEVLAMAEAMVANFRGGENLLIQGEMSLTFHLTRLAVEKGCKVFVACSNRNVVEQVKDGKTVKTSVFSFVQFRSIG